jgi:hypothetical protein
MMLTTAGRFWYSNLIFAFDALLCPVSPAPGVPAFPETTQKKRELS